MSFAPPILPSTTLTRLLDEIIGRIVPVAQPVRLVLFGSGARGQATMDSDLDVLVVIRAPAHRRQTAQAIERHLHGLALPVDVVVVTEEDLTQHAENPGSVLRYALQEGRVIYEAR